MDWISLKFIAKLDLDASPMELVYWYSPLLPREFFSHQYSLSSLPSEAMHHLSSSSYLSLVPALEKADYLFVMILIVALSEHCVTVPTMVWLIIVFCG